MCYITYSFIKRNEWGNPLFIIEWGEKMELLESIKEMVLPLIEQNDCYLDDIEYVKDTVFCTYDPARIFQKIHCLPVSLPVLMRACHSCPSQ